MILSLRSFFETLKRWSHVLLFCAVLCFVTAFLYLSLRPIHYTARGLIKSHASPPTNPFAKALEFLGQEESAFSANEQLALLKCTPVLEEVVRSCTVQAHLSKKRRWDKLLRPFTSLKTEFYLWRLRKEKFPAVISSAKVVAPGSKLLTSPKEELICSQVLFNEECARTLTIHMLDKGLFTVLDKKKTLGLGRLKEPFFIDEENFFTLEGTAQARSCYFLSLLPKPCAVEALKQRLKVQKNKENTTFIEVSLSHPRREIAASIVNSVMEQFQIFLNTQGKKKIARQLDYLKLRLEEMSAQMRQLLLEQKDQLQADLEKGLILTAEDELSFMAQSQREWKKELVQIEASIQALQLDCRLSEIPINSSSFTIETARQASQNYQQQLDALDLASELLSSCQKELEKAHVTSSSLYHLLQDETLKARFEQMHQLHLRLADEQNYSDREKIALKEALETEKRYLTRHISHRREALAVEKQGLQERLNHVQNVLLTLLQKRHEQISKILVGLGESAAHFPQKWLEAQQLQSYSTLYKEMMESLAKLVESKNMGYNIDYLDSPILTNAYPPMLPNPPHLIFGSLIVALGACLLFILVLLLYEGWAWPIASCAALAQVGRRAFSTKEHLAYHLFNKGTLFLLNNAQLAHFFIRFWEDEGATTLLLTEGQIKPAPSFIKFLAEQRLRYDAIFLVCPSIENFWEEHVDTILYQVEGERLKELVHLPDNTLFYLPDRPTPPLSLKEIAPLLAKKISNSSSFSRVCAGQGGGVGKI